MKQGESQETLFTINLQELNDGEMPKKHIMAKKNQKHHSKLTKVNLNKTQTLREKKDKLYNLTLDYSDLDTKKSNLKKQRNYSLETSQNDLSRAFSTYLTSVGPGDYNLPPLAASQKIVISTKRSSPEVSMKKKTKLTYFPELTSAFQGQDSPSCNRYNPNPFKVKEAEPSFSIGKFIRFHQPSSVTDLQSNMPVAYSGILSQPNNHYKSVSIGVGKRYTLKTDKNDEETPGPAYKTDYYQSIQAKADKMDAKRDSTFGIDKSQQAKVVYPGQERELLSTQSPGPGSYVPTNKFIQVSSNKALARYSIPRSDRGLLTLQKHEGANPHSYNNSNEIYAKLLKKEGAFSMGKAERNFHFSKFIQLNHQVVKKGLL